MPYYFKESRISQTIDLGEAREETSDRRMQEHVDKMVAPGIQPSDGMVQAERKSAERPVGLVAAAVG